MALYKYRAVDKDGNPAEGTMEEASARRVVLALEERGLTVSAVEDATPKRSWFRRESRLRWSDLDQLTEQLYTITRSGLPLAPSIAAMAKDLRNPRLKHVLEDIMRDLDAGRPLDEAFEARAKNVSPVYRALIRAGERTGDLAGVFQCLSDYSRRMLILRNNLQEALTYPAMLILAACIILPWIMLRVVPTYMQIFQDFGGELPLPTRVLLHISSFLSAYSYLVIPILAFPVILGVAVVAAIPRSQSRGYYRDGIRMYFPVVGRLYARASQARFCRTLGMMLEARVPLIESLDLAAASAGNAVLARAVTRAAQQVSAGVSLADALEKTGHFDYSFCWLLRNGEQRGEAPHALFVLEEGYDRYIEHMRQWILTLIGPAAVIVIGMVVAFVIVSLYLPIFSLGDVISGN